MGSSLVYHFACVSTGRIKKNDGRKQFLRKWNVSQKDFDRHVLRRGEVAHNTVAIDSVDLSQFKLKSELMIRFKR